MPTLPLITLLPTGRLIHRRRQSEWMDDPGLAPEQHERALAGLARLNRAGGTVAALWPTVARAASREADRPLRVLDVACGGGDVTLGLWQRARFTNQPIELAGCDISPTAIAHARDRAAAQHARVTFFEHDAVHESLLGHYDLAITSLFLHHLPEGEAIALLAMLGAHCRQIVVDDLVRSTWGWLAAWGGSRVLTRNPIVHVDALRSVEGAFTPNELRGLAGHAGLEGVRMYRRFPARMQLHWSAE